MTGHNQRVGKWGEKVAASHLQTLGYTIVEVNHRTPFGELDIIAREDGMLVFVEVKTRTTTALGNPEGSITSSKQQHIINSALHYISTIDTPDEDWRVDVVAITGKPGKGALDIQVFPNAIYL
ncbi:MAG: YraN family protein [Anaerolinea sp.]|nr:YraN family protein [Anaerolinea sp.]